MIRVTVTGSECTGKTTLAAALASHYRTVVVPEYVRRWVDDHGAAPTLADVDEIARGHVVLADILAGTSPGLLVLDTDLLSTWVYSNHYFGGCPEWVDRAVDDRAADLYLLADIDVPWEPDGDQRDRGHMRSEMHALFRGELERRGLRFVEVSGPHQERMEVATRVVDRLIG